MLCGKVKWGEREWEDRWKALPRGWRWSDRQGRRGAGCGRRAAWGRLRPGCGTRGGWSRWGQQERLGDGHVARERGVLAGFSGSSGCWGRDIWKEAWRRERRGPECRRVARSRGEETGWMEAFGSALDWRGVETEVLA